MFIGNLPPDASEESVRELFSKYGTVHSIQLNMDIFTGKCRGYGTVAMEGHEARAAMAELDGKSMGGRPLKIRFDKDQRKGGSARRHR
ncbi:RNA recognition motif domain-containing protein [Kaarinaea lacus]